MNQKNIYHQAEDNLAKEVVWINEAKANPEKFGPLYRKYYPEIFRYIKLRILDQDQALDITSQVFLKALNKLSGFEYRGVPFGAWLYRIAKSELYQSFRDSKAHLMVNVESCQIFEAIEQTDFENDESDQKFLLQCLSKLRASELRLIEMRFFEKLSFKEIGEVLEIKENNAKVKTFRALEKLKSFFKVMHAAAA
jgi:RNA polymerase sigma-70 factor (ECF subfamily)